jgi:hypothetical protein
VQVTSKLKQPIPFPKQPNPVTNPHVEPQCPTPAAYRRPSGRRRRVATLSSSSRPQRLPRLLPATAPAVVPETLHASRAPPDLLPPQQHHPTSKYSPVLAPVPLPSWLLAWGLGRFLPVQVRSCPCFALLRWMDFDCSTITHVRIEGKSVYFSI